MSPSSNRGESERILVRKQQPRAIIWFLLGMIGAVFASVALWWMVIEFWYGIHTFTFWFQHVIVAIAIGIQFYVVLHCRNAISLLRKRREVARAGSGRYKLTSFSFIASLLIIAGFTFIPRVNHVAIAPHLSYTGDPATTITVSWYTREPCETRLYLGISSHGLMNETVVSGNQRLHEVQLTGLSPNTRYYYNVSGFEGTWSFMTATGDTENLSFGVISDVHQEIHEMVVNGLLAVDPSFIINTGDLVNFGGWTGSWEKYYNGVKPLCTRYPMMTAIGNHDTMLGGMRNYKKFHAMPASSGTERYYYFTCNGVHFISLDLEWGIETFDHAQREWLIQVLDTIPEQDWLVVFNHCSHFTSTRFQEKTGMVDAFHSLFNKHDVDMVLTGHNHHFEILQQDTVTYIINGIAGHHFESWRAIEQAPQSLHVTCGKPGFLEIRVFHETTNITAHLFEENGQEITVSHLLER
ncbi:hypothetical protein GF325_12500 [Candidatus Bathyarchaeota archaeon]|nr:hypothetical protein [Candidatus Bathyarchaeota archaeon]